MDPEQIRNGGGKPIATTAAVEPTTVAAPVTVANTDNATTSGDQQAVEAALNEFIDQVTPRVNVLENEVMYAWQALDLLSDEYVKMWERIEKLESIIQNQQSVIGQMIEMCSEPATCEPYPVPPPEIGNRPSGLSMIWEESESSGSNGVKQPTDPVDGDYREYENRLLDDDADKMDSAESAKEIFENIEQMERNMRQLYAEAQLDSWNDETERAAAAQDLYPLDKSLTSSVSNLQHRMYPYTSQSIRSLPAIPKCDEPGRSPSIFMDASSQSTYMNVPSQSTYMDAPSQSIYMDAPSHSTYMDAPRQSPYIDDSYRPESPPSSPPPPAPEDPVYSRTLSSALSLSLCQFHNSNKELNLLHKFHNSTRDLNTMHQLHSSSKELDSLHQHRTGTMVMANKSDSGLSSMSGGRLSSFEKSPCSPRVFDQSYQISMSGPSGLTVVTCVTTTFDTNYPYYDRSVGVYSTAGQGYKYKTTNVQQPSISNVPDLLDVMSYKEYKKPVDRPYHGITDTLTYYPSTMNDNMYYDREHDRSDGTNQPRYNRYTGTHNFQIRRENDGKRRDDKTKKSKRNIIKSAMSTVSSSVSNWFPDMHLPQRHRSHSLPGGLEREPDAVSVHSETAMTSKPRGWHTQRHGSRKKKKSIVSTMSGLLHKTTKPNRFLSSYSISDPEFAENEWTQLKSVNRPVPPEPPPPSSDVTNKIIIPQQETVLKQIDEVQLSTEIFNGPTQEFPISKNLSKYREHYKLSNGVTEGEQPVTVERRNKSMEEQPTKSNEESPQPINNVRTLKMSSRQASLEVPWGGKGSADTEDDSRSNHSWRSTSRISSRRQSTEESIDSDDEWYCYELKQLEELEKKTHFERVFGPQILPPPTTRNESSVLGSKADFKEKMSKTIEDMRKQSVDESSNEDTFEPEQLLDTVIEEELPQDDGLIKFKKMKVPDTPGCKKEIPSQDLDIKPEQETEQETETADEQMIVEEDESPGTPSLPRFKFDKTDLIDKEEGGSKWKIVKALKEKKPDEINQDIGPPPTPIIEVNNFKYVYFYVSIIKSI